MLLRAVSSSILLIGGCTERQEAGALRSIEEVAFRQTESGLNASSRIVGQLQQPRRSPAVLRERNAALIDSSGVIVGGFNGNDCLKSVEIFKMNEKEVVSTTLENIPFRIKNGVAVSVGDDSILLFGGWDESHTTKAVFRLSFNKQHDSYHVDMESILPYDVEGHCCAIHNGYVYIIGGYDGISVLGTIIRYSIADKKSEILPVRLSTPRENHVCEVVFDRYIVVMAGWDGKRALDSVEVFEIVDEPPYLVPVSVNLKLAQITGKTQNMKEMVNRAMP
ncbi:kelch repeat protein [Necator americanus]|uniref:Kelch repeat protein n=1 Tax=Necator americanus TaxID=51031 RepID=W2T4Q3_NECAM|nr:kelch repeat protein [Necator americanus]ETN75937.1 kelch repeat protein [Necator americanus]